MLPKKRKKTTSFRFKPFSRKQKQLLMWWCSEKYRDYDMIIAHGSIRAGKTISMIDSFVTWSLSEHEHQNFIIAGKSMGALKRNVIEPLFQILTAKKIEYHYHRSENPHIIIGTNTYYLFGANNESSQDVLQGLTAAGAYLDEVALFPRSFVEQAIGRCSAETNENGAKIFFNCNPAGPYHWFKEDYIDKSIEKKILVLHFTMDDNPSLSQRVKDRYKRMFTGVFYKRAILGMWVLASGIIYDMFDEDKHAIDDKDLFDAEGKPLTYQEHYIAIDYGTKNPTAFIHQAVRYDNKKRIYYHLKEYYYDGRKAGRQKTDQQYFDDLVEFAKGIPNPSIYIDPSAASFITLIEQDGRFMLRRANNDVVDGIRTVARAIGDNCLFVHQQCSNTLREFSSYVWDEKAAMRGEDKPIKENDHALDAVRYGIYTSETAVKVDIRDPYHDYNEDNDDYDDY